MCIRDSNKDVRESSKNQERNKNTVKNTARNDSRREKYGKKPERRYAPEQTDAGRGYSGDTEMCIRDRSQDGWSS